MKKCIPRTSDRIITVLAAIVCAIAAFLAFRELLHGGQSPVVFFAMGILLGGIAIHIIWRMIYVGNWGFFYDDEKIIFALSRKDRREFRWEELQNTKTNIFYPSSPAAWYFYFQDEKKTRKIAVTPRMAGYNEFVDMLKKKGFPAQSPGAFNFDKIAAKDIFHEVFGEDFGKDSKNESK
ncbi:hypothetical protein D5278_09330 [bacterium 1XD21-13]|nr:hypothetical protein [bacterium 1XD21-13]